MSLPLATIKSLFSLFVPAVLLTFFGLLSACPKETQPLPPLSLDEALNTEQVRCGPVTKESELIGGVAAYAQVGRSWRCYNNKIRFIIQDGSRPVGNSSIGGDLIDMDLIRNDELIPGHDSFREFAPAIGFNETTVEKIEVIDDGRNGQQAILRITGHPTPPTMVPGACFLSQEIVGRIETDYILHPNSSMIEIRTSIYNESPNILGPLAAADFWAAGRSTWTHSPVTGFGKIEVFSHIPFLASGQDGFLNFAYICKDNDVIIPMIDGSITLPICTDDLHVADSASYTRYIAIGDGSVDSVARQAWKLKGVALGEVQGQVKTPEGDGVAKVWVSALSGPLDDDDSVAVNQARSDADGRFSMALPEGDYRLIAHIPGRDRSAENPVQISGDSHQHLDLILGAQAQLVVDTTFRDALDLETQKMPAKLSVVAYGDITRPSKTLGEFVKPYQVSVDGHFDINLPPGEYDIYVSRGFEFTRYLEHVILTGNDSVHVEAQISHVVDTTGWLGAEFHQHTLGSVDATVPYPVKVKENAAEGIEFAASTDHDNIIDFTPWIEALGLSPFLSAVPGNEVSYQGIGHFNVYPWNIDPADPYKHVGTRIWWGKTVPELFADLREMAGDPIIQINHPRSSIGFFATMGLDPSRSQLIPQDLASIPTLPPTVFQDWSSNFDTIEVNDSLGEPSDFTSGGLQHLHTVAIEHPHDIPVLADYFALLGAGAKIAATGVSDSHTRNSGAGYPRTFVYVNEDDPQLVDGAKIRTAMRAQATSIGRGCFIDLRVDDQARMGLIQALTQAELGRVKLRIQAPPFVQLEKLEIYVNGLVRKLHVDNDAIVLGTEGEMSLPLSGLEQGEVLRLNAALQGIADDEDAVIVAVARGGDGLRPIAHGSPFCISAPLYIDRSGDGWIPWKADEQTLINDASLHSHPHPHPHP